MAVKAFVLLAVDPTLTNQVFDALHEVPGIVSKSLVMGPYDIILRLETPGLDDVPDILSAHVRNIPGIESTTTLIAFPNE